MRPNPGVITLLLLTAPLRGDGLDALRARLRRPEPADPVKVTVEAQIWSQKGDLKSAVVAQGKASAWVEAGPQGMKVQWGRDVIRQATQEGRLQQRDPDAPAPTRTAMAALDAMTLQDCFNAAPRLLSDLDQATLLEERPDLLDGRPCTLLNLKLNPRLGAAERKYVKEINATGKVWLGADGQPLAAEAWVKLKGSAMLVIHFGAEEHQSFRFAQVAGRLVAVRHLQESSGSGAGESSQKRTQLSLVFN